MSSALMKNQEFKEIEKKVRDCQNKIFKNKHLSDDEKWQLWRHVEEMFTLYYDSLKPGEKIQYAPGITITLGFSEGFNRRCKERLEKLFEELS